MFNFAALEPESVDWDAPRIEFNDKTLTLSGKIVGGLSMLIAILFVFMAAVNLTGLLFAAVFAGFASYILFYGKQRGIDFDQGVVWEKSRFLKWRWHTTHEISEFDQIIIHEDISREVKRFNGVVYHGLNVSLASLPRWGDARKPGDYHRAELLYGWTTRDWLPEVYRCAHSLSARLDLPVNDFADMERFIKR